MAIRNVVGKKIHAFLTWVRRRILRISYTEYSQTSKVHSNVLNQVKFCPSLGDKFWNWNWNILNISRHESKRFARQNSKDRKSRRKKKKRMAGWQQRQQWTDYWRLEEHQGRKRENWREAVHRLARIVTRIIKGHREWHVN